MSKELQPPSTKNHEFEDGGAHELASSEDGSEDFVDASEGVRPPNRSGGESPIPITRVERVDDEPAYGEVPGTNAYSMRTADAVPDEIEVVPEGTRSRSASRVSRPSTPGGTRVPRMVVEKIDPDEPSYGDVPGTAAYEMRKADAEPDEIIRSPASSRAPANPFKGQASPTASHDRSDADLDEDELDLDDRANDPGGGGGKADDDNDDESKEDDDDDHEDEDDDDDDDDEQGFGDDFDDFEEGQEADADDDDFGEFDEGFQQQQQSHAPPPAPSLHQQPPSIPIPDFRDLDDLESIQSVCAPYLRALFPSYPPATPTELPTPNQQIFLSERSVSLYTQLIAPPPLAPPDWLRSRIRRLFLVSLGVPVDLDEILPASKQKKLVLPSGLLKKPSSDAGRSPRPSTSNDDKSQLGKLKAAHDSDGSLTSTASGQQRKPRRKGTAREAEKIPEFDVAAARRLGQTTKERIDGMSDEELKEHLEEMERVSEKGREYLGYWQRKVEEAGREKEAFEGVIENLVSFARKVRK